MREIASVADILIADGGSTDGSTNPDVLRALGVRGVVALRQREGLGSQLRAAYACALREVTRESSPSTATTRTIRQRFRSYSQLRRRDGLRPGLSLCPGGKAINTPWIRTLGIKLIHAPLVSLAAGGNGTRIRRTGSALQPASAAASVTSSLFAMSSVDMSCCGT